MNSVRVAKRLVHSDANTKQILQVLIFCIPLYDFLDQVRKRAAHSFKSDTPLLDAMIMFMREYKVIDSAESVEKLRMRLKDNELEQYGDSFIPEYVYDVIKRLPRFASMRVRVPKIYVESKLIIDSVDTSRMPKNFLVSSWKDFMMNVLRF
jgi:hypothetical protein